MAAGPAAAGAGGFDDAWFQTVLERYFGFGVKASGGPGDNACGAWLEGELSKAGYACRRQVFEVPFFEVRQATLASGGASAPVIPQAVVVPTGPGGVSGPLSLADRPGDLAGAIALVVLPFRRWAAVDAEVMRRLSDAFGRGAAAAVLVTTGPSGEAIALNTSPAGPSFPRPVAVLAPKDAAPFLAAAQAGRPGVLTVDGQGGRRPAFNLIGGLQRGAAGTLILSTPRSGWFGCAGERGSGLAVWLHLALWAAKALPRMNVELICTSGHEYQYLGGAQYIEHAAPKPEVTRLWAHLGANVAARDWHELGSRLAPLPSADPQRVLMATPDLVPGLKRAFAGLAGLEAVYSTQGAASAGELTNVLQAGYARALGVFGAHRYFHTREDDLRCTSGVLVRPAAEAFRRSISGALA
jgi:hypothetical protein